MTAFFIPTVEPEDGSSEAIYRELRERSQAAAGCAPTSRRIFKIACRVDGRDCEIEVGQPDPATGELVLAIIDHGRHESYVVHTHGGVDGERVAQRIGKHVYSVTEFA